MALGLRAELTYFLPADRSGTPECLQQTRRESSRAVLPLCSQTKVLNLGWGKDFRFQTSAPYSSPSAERELAAGSVCGTALFRARWEHRELDKARPCSAPTALRAKPLSFSHFFPASSFSHRTFPGPFLCCFPQAAVCPSRKGKK